MDIWIGTSGYSYPDWVGNFYPPGLSSARMLSWYSRHFPLVELNFTFYRPPTRDVLARLADKVPVGFQFLVKLPQTISHEQSPADLPGFRGAVAELQQRGQLMGLLCQFPQATHYERRSVDWLRTVRQELPGLPLAVEFRHRSWARPGLAEWMREHDLNIVAVDVPDLPGLFPRGWAQSGERVYVRLHSRNAAKWYEGDKERYDYSYSDSELSEWVEELGRRERATASPGGPPPRPGEGPQQALFLFNNCHRGQAAVNAQRLRALLEQSTQPFSVVEPFAEAPPAQRSLFG
jgi:uncharacterized protein YecE (DUF72 family)